MCDYPLVSIVIPAYNAQNTICRCLDSCFAQTYKNLEIVVIDDGSTDSTFDLLNKCAAQDGRLQIIRSENRGVSAARNLGMIHSHGEYLVFTDADDALPSDSIEGLFGLITKYEADIAVGALKNIKEEPEKGEKDRDETVALWEGTQGLVESLKDHPATYSSCGKLYRRDFVGDTRFAEGRRIHEDSFFVFQLMMKQPKTVVTEKEVYYCYPEKNSAGRAPYSDRMLDILYFSKEKKRLIEEQYPEFTELTYNVMIKADLAFLSVCCLGNAKGVKGKEKECIKEVKQLKRYYVPMTSYNDKLFFCVTHNLYYPLKFFQKYRK